MGSASVLSLTLPPPSTRLEPPKGQATHLSRDPLEQLQHSQRVEILLSLLDVRFELARKLGRVSERLEELLCLSSDLLGSVLLVNDLESSDLLDGSVGSSTVRAVDDLSAGGVDGFGGGLTLEVLEERTTEGFEVFTTVVLFQKDVSTGLEGI